MYSSFQLIEIGVRGPLTGNEDGVPAGSGSGVAHNLAQAAFDAVSRHGIAHAFSGDETESTAIQAVGQDAHYKQTIGHASSPPVDF